MLVQQSSQLLVILNKNQVFFQKKATTLRQCPSFFGKRKNMSTKRGKSSVKQMIMGAGKTSVVSPLLLGPHFFFAGRPTPRGTPFFFGLFPLSWEYPEYFFVGKTTLKGEYQLKYHFQGGFLCIQRFSCQLSGEIIDILETSAEIPCGVWLYFCLMISHPFHNN